MTRKLTVKEIENIVDFIKPRKGIPEDTAISIMNNHKLSLKKQLENQLVYPEIIPALKEQLYKQYRTSLIQAGESVGVISAQSIGEKQTQTTLNTFHKAGQAEKTMTTGVPRFQELINATKKPRIVNNVIYFKTPSKNIKEIREKVGHSIVGITLKEIAQFSIHINKQEEKWYDAFKIIYNDKFTSFSDCVSIKLNMKKLHEIKLSLQKIAECIENEYSDLYCVFSPPNIGQIDIFVDTTNIALPEKRLFFIDEENCVSIYLEEVVQIALEKMYICGIPGITEVFYTKKDDDWIVETNGFYSKKISKQYNSFKRLLAHTDIDYTRTISNNVWDIYQVLDIEAARQFLIEEFMSIMEGINRCQSILLVDRMTFSGIILSISRHTLKADESGPMGKASFEETVDNFLNAAAQGQTEPTRGVSASIICGKKANIGTNVVKIMIDIDSLPNDKKSETVLTENF